MASTYLTRNVSCDRQKWTWSGWIKRSKVDSYQNMFASGTAGSADTAFNFNADGALSLYHREASSIRGYFESARKLRDTNGWYHLVANFDATNATGADRLVIYVNGERATGTMHNTLPQNDSGYIGNGNAADIGRMPSGSANYYDGSMAHVHFVDGTIYGASTFGSTDSTTGEWKINTSPSVTYGSGGFFILKDGNSVTDQSGNSNNFTVGGGTLTKTEDNPSNVFATFNVLQNTQGNSFSYGNNKVDIPQAKYFGAASTLGMSSGKFYCEIKLTGGATDGSGNYKSFIGISGNPSEQDRNNRYLGQDSYSYGYQGEGGSVDNAASATSYGNSYTNGDIIGIALDLDNNKLYFSKNGTWQNSGDPTSGSTGTGAVSIGTSPTGFWHFACSSTSTNYATNHAANFGNGYFQSTAVSSAGTNASNNGIFEYDVPTGYTALSTKGLNL